MIQATVTYLGDEPFGKWRVEIEGILAGLHVLHWGDGVELAARYGAEEITVKDNMETWRLVIYKG